MRHQNNKNIDIPFASKVDGFVYFSAKSAALPRSAQYSINEPSDKDVLRYAIQPLNGGLCLTIQFKNGEFWHSPSPAQTKQIAEKISAAAYSFGGGDIGGISINDIDVIDTVISNLNCSEFKVNNMFGGGNNDNDSHKVKILCDSMYRNPRTGKPY